MEALVFSSQKTPKCASLIQEEVLALVGNDWLHLYDLGETQVIAQCQVEEDMMPINMWVLPNQLIVIEGKMGTNYLFKYAIGEQYTLKFIRKYPTFMCGFCKMVKID